MEVKIGIRQIARETSVDVAMTPDEFTALFDQARASDGLLDLTDSNGHRILIPASGIGYIEFGQEHARPVGFGTKP